MAILDSQDDLVQKLLKILKIDNLTYVRSVSINIEPESIVSVKIERYLEGREIEQITKHLGKQKYILVKAEELRNKVEEKITEE